MFKKIYMWRINLKMSIGMCQVCGLPEELCICEEVAKEQQRITIKVNRRRYGKEVTIVEGLDSSEIDVQDLATYLKSKFACGGTIRDGNIELQGNHINRMKEVLIQRGFNSNQIRD